MEFKNYFKLLSRHKLTLIIVPLIAIVASVILVKMLPNAYITQTQIATGIVDQSQQVTGDKDGYIQDTRVNQEFTNLMETLQLTKVVDQVSFQLLNHDLASSSPYLVNDKNLQALSPDYKKQIVSTLKTKLSGFDVLDLKNPQEKKINDLLVAVKYDHESLLKKVKVFRSDNSDFINIEGEFNNPDESAFVVNQLSAKFLNYYASNINAGHSKATGFLGKLLTEKKNAMNKKIADLEAYKVKNGILDMGGESKDVYEQISQIETNKLQADKDVIAYTGALKGIDSHFDPKDRQYLEATSTKINSSILSTRDRLHGLNDKYIQSGFSPKYKKSIDSLQGVLESQINESSDKYISNPLASKDNLVQEKLKLENQREIARYSANSLNAQLSSLKGRLNGLVPAEAAVGSYERDIETATKEYLDVQDKYNQANVSTTVPITLRQLQVAVPGEAKPSKKILIVVLSGITSFIFCLGVLLVVFYFDDCIRSGEELEQKTRIPVLGYLNFAPSMVLNLKKKQGLKDKNDMKIFRDLLRSIRFEIDRELGDGKVIAITSLNRAEGKTLFSFSLAYAYSLINKKVLLIDGNFSHPAISDTVKSRHFIEDYFTGDHLLESPDHVEQLQKTLGTGNETKLLEISDETAIGETLQQLNSQSKYQAEKVEAINILGNRGGDISLLEINSHQVIRDKMDYLKSNFDVIIIETGSLNTLNKSKEWMMFADKTLAVFENNQNIKDTNKSSIQYLKSLNGKMLGWVLNKVPIDYADTEQI